MTEEEDEQDDNLDVDNDRNFITEQALAKPFILGEQPEMPLFVTITIYGKRRSGKSFFLRYLFDFYRDQFPWVWVFTYTKHNKFFEAFIPSKFVIKSFSASALLKIMDRQTQALKIALKEDKKFNPRAAIIWDDYNGTDVKYNEVLDNYYFTGRHYLTMNIFCAQYVKLTPPAIRSNTDYAVLFNTDYLNALEEYWKDFAGKMPKDAFYAMFRQYTELTEHGFLVIDNDPNQPYDNKFFYGKADEVPNNIRHIACCREAWEDNKEQYEEIKDGTIQKEIDIISNLSKLKKNKGKHSYKRHCKSEHPSLSLRNGKTLDMGFGNW